MYVRLAQFKCGACPLKITNINTNNPLVSYTGGLLFVVFEKVYCIQYTRQNPCYKVYLLNQHISHPLSEEKSTAHASLTIQL
jgi:hypothetical protein